MAQGSLITEVLHPFGRAFGAISAISTGVQYGTYVSTPNATTTQLSTVYYEVENVTVNLPSNAHITELEYGLTCAVIASATTATATLVVRAKDSDQSSYDSIAPSTASITGSTGTGTTIYDYTFSRRLTPSDGTYFTGESSFDMDFQIKASVTTATVAAAPKNTSYLAYTYYLMG